MISDRNPFPFSETLRTVSSIIPRPHSPQTHFRDFWPRDSGQRPGRETEFEEYVEPLRLEYKRKRDFMKLLHGIEQLQHLRRVAVSFSAGLQSRMRIAYKDGARVVSSDSETLLTEKQYLAIERRAEFRSEFHGGEMFAMVGASRRHNRIVTNLVTALDHQLQARPCNVYSNDIRV